MKPVKIIAAVMAAVFFLADFANIGLSASAASAEEIDIVIGTGSCGVETNPYPLTWTFYESGKLIIKGSGAMSDYSLSSWVPWKSYREQIKSVEISDGVTNIGMRAFDLCTELERIHIPDSVTKIADCAFAACYSLEGMKIPDGVTEIGDDAFNFCTSLVSVNIPSGVTRIVGGSFANCSTLISVTIPDTVTSLGLFSFVNCNRLTSVTIPESVTSIRSSAFDSCQMLSEVIFESETPPQMERNCFSYTPIADGNGVIKVPPSAVDAYKSADGFGAWADYIVANTECTNHMFTYTAIDNMIIEKCASCGHTAATALTLDSSVSLIYTGEEITPAKVTYGANWEGPQDAEIEYTDNINDGIAKASLTIGGATAELKFEIAEDPQKKVAVAKAIAEKVLEELSVSNDTSGNGMIAEIDLALAAESVFGVNVTVKKFFKTAATNDADGSITCSFVIFCNGALETIPFSRTIARLSGGTPGGEPTVSTPTESGTSESEPTVNEPTESKPTESESSESKPVESEPAESNPTESKPAESKPTEIKPAEIKPTMSEPIVNEPTESKPTESKPTESETTENDPPVSEPIESTPNASEPTASEPPESEPTVSEPTMSEPPESNPTESDPTESKPTESEPTESTAPESEPPQSEPTESAPADSTVLERTPNESGIGIVPVVAVIVAALGAAAVIIENKRK